MSRERKQVVSPDKTEVISELTEKLQKASIIILSDYQGVIGSDGLTVKEIKALRSKLLENKAELKVAKNTLTKRAMMEAGGYDPLFPYLEGSTAIAIGYDEPASIAKVLLEFAKAHKNPKNESGLPKVKAGILDGKLLSMQAIQTLAALPSKDVLLANMLRSLQAPVAQFIRTIQAPLQNKLNILDQLCKKKAAESGAA